MGSELRQVFNCLRRLGASRPHAGLSDAALLERFVAGGEQAAFETLLERHGPLVWSVCRRLLPDPHLAEDAFQATFLVLVRRAGAIGRPHQLGSWLYGVASRVAARARSQSQRRAATEHAETEHLPGRPAPDPVALEQGRILHEELGRLPTHYRLPLVLCYLEGRKQEEVAELLGWTRNVLRGRLERARLRLRGRLERRGLTLAPVALGLLGLHSAAEAALSPALLRATLAAAAAFAGRPGVAEGVPSPAAVALAEGVSRMLFFARVRIVLATVLLAGLCGGVGLLAGPGKNPTPASRQSAEEKGQPHARPKAPSAKEDQDAVTAARQEGEAEADRLEERLEKQEALWEDERLEARKELLRQEEELRRLERQQQRERADDEADHVEAQKQLAQARRELAAFKGKGGSPAAAAWKLRCTEAREELATVEKRAQDRDRSHFKEVITLRQQMLATQERIQRLERRQARQRQHFEADLDAALRRARQARGSGTVDEASSGRVERKVDQLVRELESLRRALSERERTKE